MNNLIYVAIGVLLSMVVEVISHLVELRRIKKIAEKASSNQEKVLSYNATIIVNESTNKFCWFDNDKVTIIKSNNRGDK